MDHDKENTMGKFIGKNAAYGAQSSSREVVYLSLTLTFL
jgi:hypothetical protein